MSKEAIERTTLAAIRQWANSDTDESYAAWIAKQFRAGRYWGAQEKI